MLENLFFNLLSSLNAAISTNESTYSIYNRSHGLQTGLYLNLADDNHLTYIKGTINRMQKLHIQQIHDLGVVNV